MALDLRLEVHTTDDCRNLVIEDVTGNYSEDNLGGWGTINIYPYKEDISIDISVQAYMGTSENITIHEGTFSLDTFQGFMFTPSEESFKGFKLSIPAETFNQELGISSELSTLDDTLYQVNIRVYALNDLTDMHGEYTMPFKNTCMTSALVSKTLSSINLLADDCEEDALEKALLAKSLLESLEN